MAKETEITIDEGGTAAEGKTTKVPLKQKVQCICEEHPPASNPWKYATSMCELLEQGFTGLFFLAMGNLIPIALIAVGVTYWDKDENCTAADIALYLVLGGAAYSLRTVTGTLIAYCESSQRENDKPSCGLKCLRFLKWAFNLFLVVLHFVTCYTTYLLYSHVDYDKKGASAEDYCNRFLFLFSFWAVSCLFILMGLAIAILCCIGFCVGSCSICFLYTVASADSD